MRVQLQPTKEPAPMPGDFPASVENKQSADIKIAQSEVNTTETIIIEATKRLKIRIACSTSEINTASIADHCPNYHTPAKTESQPCGIGLTRSTHCGL